MSDEQAQALWDAIENIVATVTALNNIQRADLVREAAMAAIAVITNKINN